jgi:uncharacterized protein Yka (UPF0111/DUF47 family)
MVFSLLPKEDDYFKLFSAISSKIQDASNILVAMTEDNSGNFEFYVKKIKKIEH